MPILLPWSNKCDEWRWVQKAIKSIFEGPFFATITTKSNLGTKTMFTVNKIKSQMKKGKK